MARVSPQEQYLSVITLGEIRRGVEQRRLKDPRAATELERWLLALQTHHAEKVLPITHQVAERWGRISPKQPLPTADGLIAATALENDLVVVTRNTADFERSGVETLNPFD